MPKNIRGIVELGAQIAIALATVLIAGVVVKRYLFPPQLNSSNLPRITVGERLSVPDVNWQQNKKTLVFFLMKDCVYCKTSAPFYRQLIEDASKRDVKLLAILPNSVEEGRIYLHSLDLSIDDVRNGPLSAYKVSGTPTVLFVDDQGIVKGAWFGSAPERDKQMRDELIALFDASGARTTVLK